MRINIKKLNDNAVIPTRGSDEAAGYDLYACLLSSASLDGYIIIDPHKTVKISTGLSIEIPKGYFGGIFARSGLATKDGLRPANCTGVIDSDYRGEIIVALHNDTNSPQVINHGNRIAQLIIMPYLKVEFNEVEELADTQRGDEGFGSTGE